MKPLFDEANASRLLFSCSWEQFDRLIQTLVPAILADGRPDLIVGIQRGGLIPSVLLAHQFDLPLLLALPVRCTASDDAYASKRKPVIEGSERLATLTRRNVLVVDDVAGSGATMREVVRLLQEYHPARIRTLVTVLNVAHWQQANNEDPPATLFSYIGQSLPGWVVFPWENPSAQVPAGVRHCPFPQWERKGG
ncbi:MAG TPA: phosphoribosyltransferase family protein [Ktedonosporobacter sp.]|nr:phosphoribosyltransferase family protein [Ktedonosporobacter sp.]